MSSIAVLPRFDNPGVLHLLVRQLLLIALVDLFVPFMIVPQKLEVSLVLKTFLHVESQREEIKHILVLFLIIVSHRVEQGFLVADHVVVYQMILHALLLDFTSSDCSAGLEVFGT